MRRHPFLMLAAIILTVVVAWTVWWQAAHHDTRNQPAARETRTAAMPSSSEQARLKTIAERFEHASRDWGTDPASWDKGLTAIRTPDTMSDAAMGKVSTLKRAKTLGPDAPSPWCGDDPNGAVCATWPTMLDYWRQQAWTMGARVDGMDVSVNTDGTVRVSGRSRIIIWSDTQNAITYRGIHGGEWWDLSPVTGTRTWTDTLTITNGRVTARQSAGNTDWMADPWFKTWNTNPMEAAGSLTDRRQDGIPVEGQTPDLGLTHDRDVDVLANRTILSGSQWEQVFARDPERMNANTGDSTYD